MSVTITSHWMRLGWGTRGLFIAYGYPIVGAPTTSITVNFNLSQTFTNEITYIPGQRWWGVGTKVSRRHVHSIVIRGINGVEENIEEIDAQGLRGKKKNHLTMVLATFD